MKNHFQIPRGFGYTICMAKVGRPTLPEIEKRTEPKNKLTINRLLNLYDIALEEYGKLIKTLAEIEDVKERAAILNDFKVLVSMVDPLMKRWYLVHRGYDSNARIAEAEVKAKLAQTEQAALEADLSIEEKITEVGHWNPAMQELLMDLPQLDSEEADDT